MNIFQRLALAALLPLLAAPLWAQADNQPDDARTQQIFQLTNQDRQQHGLPPLQWNAALASAAVAHCRQMAEKAALSHQFPGEPDLMTRAAAAGAHFQAIAENVASGPGPSAVEHEWMNSTAHRTNILDPKMDQIGVAVVVLHGGLYAVEDFSSGVQQMDKAQVEQKVGALLEAQNVTVVDHADPATGQAEQACSANQGIPAGARFVVRFQTSDLSQLPGQVAQQVASGRYTKAAVGACAPSGVPGSFTMFRVAVLFY
ncbi:CAP domain-containing protein [Paracidobacterium acidisoli]|uniref:CAP domain-containing protein n=1 Tax=Paracidobacterium acidisoli TaxID=2303751 RepID=A0A372ITA8_9BACT|nr:CAP domain-containing protein [Paracidobacterium acidisoli]